MRTLSEFRQQAINEMNWGDVNWVGVGTVATLGAGAIYGSYAFIKDIVMLVKEIRKWMRNKPDQAFNSQLANKLIGELKKAGQAGNYKAFNMAMRHVSFLPSQYKLFIATRITGQKFETSNEAMFAVRKALLKTDAMRKTLQSLGRPKDGSKNTRRHEPPIYKKQDDAHVKKFFQRAVRTEDGSSVTTTSLYDHYVKWSTHRSLSRQRPLDFREFSRSFDELGVQKAKISGRVRYIGITLKPLDGSDGSR